MTTKGQKEQQNIFNYQRRFWDDGLKKKLPFLGVSQQKLQEEITKTAENNQKIFQAFMEKQYIQFDVKINKCKLKCVKNGSDYRSINQCYGRCEEGVRSYRRYVDDKISEMHGLMNQCIDNAQKMPGILYEVYHCYQLYNRGLPHLKWLIKKQSLYYE